MQVVKSQEEFQNVSVSLPKKEIFSRVASGRKDKCFLLANYAIAFVKEGIESDTFGSEVIKSKHLYDSPIQPRLMNKYLYHRRKKKKLRLKVLQKNKFNSKICMFTRKA